MESNNNPKNSFVESFINVESNLNVRYSINKQLDFINEFIKFADNTRDLNLLKDIERLILGLKADILNFIDDYEKRNKENID